MNARIAILAALPREIEPLVRDWPVRRRSRSEGFVIFECDQAIAVCAGMGHQRVTYALALAEAQGPIRSIISAGYAGALHFGIRRNTIYWPATVIDGETGERYECVEGSGTLVTVDRILGHDEKTQIAQRWNADLVDMEAATVARLAQTRGIPFRTVRAVSDEAGDVLPDLNRFMDVHGGFRQAAFAFYIAFHPWLIPATIRLGRQSAWASQAMALALREVLERAE